eukprot:14876068-Heterocapsa_arctica.AAC.1
MIVVVVVAAVVVVVYTLSDLGVGVAPRDRSLEDPAPTSICFADPPRWSEPEKTRTRTRTYYYYYYYYYYCYCYY